MNTRIIAVLATAVLVVSAQARTIFAPDGALLYRSTGDTFKSIAAAMQEYHPGVPYHMHIIFDDPSSVTVAFKLLREEPLLVIFDDNRDTDSQRADIQAAIDSFDYGEYLNGWDLSFDLKTLGIELGLGDIYVIESLGPPSSYTKSTTARGSISLVGYRQYHLLLTFVNGRLAEVLESW